MNDANNVNLNLIKYFIVAAESESFAEAGEKLGYTAGNVSTSIAMLENQYGVKLFTRKPLRLTEIGQEIYDTIKRGYREIDYASVIADSKNNIDNGKISIGCPSHITEFFLMSKLAKAEKEHPNLQINLDTESDSRTLIKLLRNNKIDFAILDLIPDDSYEGLEVKELKSIENIFIANEKIEIKDIKDLENYKYILSYKNKTSTKRLEKVLEKYNVELKASLRCPTTEPRVKAAKLGIGIAYVMKESAKCELENQEVYQVDVPIKLPTSNIIIVYLQEHLTKVDREFIKKYLIN